MVADEIRELFRTLIRLHAKKGTIKASGSAHDRTAFCTIFFLSIGIALVADWDWMQLNNAGVMRNDCVGRQHIALDLGVHGKAKFS